MRSKIPKLPLQGLQAMQMHFDGYQNHHPCNIAEGDPLSYFVKPVEETWQCILSQTMIKFLQFMNIWNSLWGKVNTRLSIPLPRPSVSPERRSNEQTTNSLSNWTPAVAGSTCKKKNTPDLIRSCIWHEWFIKQ